MTRDDIIRMAREAGFFAPELTQVLPSIERFAALLKQALAFTMRDFTKVRDFEAARAVLHDALRERLKEKE